MNPFDLPGPQFLLFYGVLAIVTILVAAVVTRRAENGPAPPVKLSDPYGIAYLRGGKNEALRLATISLIDRGLLTVQGERLVTAHNAAPDLAQRAIERALLEKFTTADSATAIFNDRRLESACADYARSLADLGLLPNSAARDARRRRFRMALLVLLGVAGSKLILALMRGRSNVGFLLVMTGVAVVMAYKVTHPSRTARGSALLADLRTLFAGLKARRRSILPGGATSEAALLAAVYGLSMLPAAAFPYVQKLYPRAATSEGSGASCGASCGSSCGSSCGGGGGGGCGGCGSS
jgi:uncharacterized protein (TIGR04222 family)